MILLSFFFPSRPRSLFLPSDFAGDKIYQQGKPTPKLDPKVWTFEMWRTVLLRTGKILVLVRSFAKALGS